MKRNLFGLKGGGTGPVAAIRGICNLARTIWDPTRSDVQRGINTLVADALADATPERIAEFERAQPEVAALFAERYDPDVDPASSARSPRAASAASTRASSPPTRSTRSPPCWRWASR